MGVSLSKSPDLIAGMFDAIANDYDLLNHLLSAGIDRRWRKRAIAALELAGTERVLDLCTGTADLAIAARTARPPAARVVGVDFAGAMLRAGRTKVSDRRLGDTISLVRADATQSPIADGSVDAVTIGFGIRNVENAKAVCDEISRVLRPGGRLAILEFAIPATPMVRAAYLAYFRYVLPQVGQLISHHNAAYRYLPASVAAFASPDEFMKLLRQHRFADIKAIPLTFGIVFLYTARRSAALEP
ncbi:MAG: bifunctional demethylmenaquinone methyltransferase/2-methoxy-6-polyprenyl-1,4-benzoquinol methylase UbiE [Blastocatellia bacterium]|nr:MAG: bifunctional demethylmenaquinone methyltransferase/2-methoxy-6-polyprenyl-1,4-benzoquinol methylase UbiE [Blastocatellia bacterium]